MGGACLLDNDCAAGLFCDTLNRGGMVAVASYAGNNTLPSDFGQCTDAYAPYTKCDAGHSCQSPYTCIKPEGSASYYCMGGSGGTQFNGWVKVGGVGFIPSANAHTGTTSAQVSGLNTSYAYSSVLAGALEGGRKYLLGF